MMATDHPEPRATQAGKRPARRWVALGVALVAALGLGLAWSRRDPLPVRAVIRPQGWFWEEGFARDGRSYLIQVRGGLVRYDASTGREAGSVPLGSKLLPQAWIEDEDGRTALAATDAPDGRRELLCVEVATGAVAARFPVPPGWSACCPRPVEGGRAVAALLVGGKSPPEAITWDVATGAATRRPLVEPPHLLAIGKPRRIGGTDDGRAWAYNDPTRGDILVWDAAVGRPLGPALRNPAAPPAAEPRATFAADGRTLAVARPSGQVEFWDVAEGRLVRTVVAHRRDFAPTMGLFSPDGRLLITLAQTTGVSWRNWALDRYNRLVHWRWRIDDKHETVVIDVAAGAILARWPGVMYPPQFSPDGRTLAVQGPDGSISLRTVPAKP